MTVTLNRRNAPEPPKSGIAPANPNINRHGAWGIVREAYSKDHSADVLIDGGALLSHVPVASPEWVCPGDEFTSGERNLPPVGARVFVMMPTGNFDGCFALCSGLAVTGRDQEEAFMGEGKEKIRKRVTPGNWKTESHHATGTFEAVSPDGKTVIKIDYGTEEEPKDAPELRLNIFDRIKCGIISDDGAALSVFDELKIEHKKGDSAKVAVFGAEILIKNGEVSIKSGGKIYLGGSAGNMCALLLALADELIGFQTAGPPPQHVTHPQTVAKLNAFKEKIKALFKESE